MQTQKPYQPVLPISVHAKELQLYRVPHNFSIALEIDPGNNEINKNIFNYLTENDIPFLILINGTAKHTFDIISREIIDFIILCLFRSSYIREKDNPVIALIEPADAHLQTVFNQYAESLIGQLLLQGWAEITKWYLPFSLSFREQVLRKSGTPLLIQQLDFTENFLLKTYFPDSSNAGNYIFFKSTEPYNSEILEREFFSLCNTAMNEQPFLKAYVFQYINAKKDAEKNYKEKKAAEERLKNAEITISIIKSKYKEDYAILFKWYQNEYEVLPLWYKRFGHVLKAIAGRRTVKSLFSRDKNK